MDTNWLHAFRPRALWHLLKEAASDWSHDHAPRLGAALAYYTVFSLVPFLVVVIALIGLVFGQEAAQSAILGQIAELVGEQSAAAIKDMIQRADKPSTGLFATGLAVLTLLVGASGVFGQLQDALNTVWGVEPKEGRGVWGVIKDRFLSFVAVLGTGFLLLVSLVLSSALAAAGKWFSGWLPLPEAVLHAVNLGVSFAVITGLFALIFKVLPDAQVAWRDVWVGAALTAALFTIGKLALGLYLGKSNVASGYGAAGSLVLVLLWVYYSAQIMLYGAEFTQVYANRLGERIVATPDAKVTDPRKADAPLSGQRPAPARNAGHAA
jgi:membrane protein